MKQINEGGTMKKLFASILVGALGFGFVAFAAEEAATVTAKVPEKPWSVSTSYFVKRAVQVVADAEGKKNAAAASEGSLGLAWKWTEALSSSLSLGFTNTWNPAGSLVATDPSATVELAKLVSTLGADFTGSLSVTAPVTEKSRGEAEGFFAQVSTGLAVGTPVQVSFLSLGGADPLTGAPSGLSLSYNAARSRVESNELASLSGLINAATSWLGLSWLATLNTGASLNYKTSSPVYSVSVTPVVVWKLAVIEELLSVSLLSASTVAYDTKKKDVGATNLISSSVAWTPAKGAQVKLSYTPSFKGTAWRDLAQLKNHSAKLAVSYEF